MIDWLLLFVPVTALLEFLAPGQHGWIFVSSALAIVPLAGWMGRATEHLAERTGEGVGGLLNATFGNAAELIIGIAALRAGLYEVVKASIAGSILGNILLVLGAAMFAGGLRFNEQRYNVVAARSQSTLLALAAIALTFPALYHVALGAEGAALHQGLSLTFSLILLGTYAMSLVFQLVTHKALFAGNREEAAGHAASWSIRRSVLVLLAATALIAWMSEVLVGAVEPAALAFGMNKVFIGVIVVALLGNAAEHVTAVTVARKNRMDLSLSIALGSSVQVALFVAPVLVLLSHVLGPVPMDLAFRPALVLIVFLSILIAGQIAGDGESNWLKGASLLVVYLIVAIAFYYAPMGASVLPR